MRMNDLPYLDLTQLVPLPTTEWETALQVQGHTPATIILSNEESQGSY